MAFLFHDGDKVGGLQEVKLATTWYVVGFSSRTSVSDCWVLHFASQQSDFLMHADDSFLVGFRDHQEKVLPAGFSQASKRLCKPAVQVCVQYSVSMQTSP